MNGWNYTLLHYHVHKFVAIFLVVFKALELSKHARIQDLNNFFRKCTRNICMNVKTIFKHRIRWPLSGNHLMPFSSKTHTHLILSHPHAETVIKGSKGPTISCPFQVINNLQPKASTRSSNMMVIISIIITIVVVICFCLIVSILYQLKRNKRIVKLPKPTPFRDDRYKKVPYSDIAKATDGFSSDNLVGSGSFRSVYKGMLDNQAVAVKVFDLEQHGALRSFNYECESLRNIRHKNLVSVITLCSSIDFKGNEFKALVFEYIPNGSLDDWIHGKSSGKKLSLADGINIAMDVASGMSYLHHHCVTPMVHCDIKPGNILIDTDMTALVSDFGLARFLAASHSTSSEVSTTLLGLKGTIGYIPPEYALGSTISTQGDVYSFGIVLLEMLTGKRPTDAMFIDGFNIHAYVSSAFPEKIIEILDPSMFGEFKCLENNQENSNDLLNMVMEKCIIPLVHVGVACSKEALKERMRMEDVAAEISKIKQIYLGSI